MINKYIEKYKSLPAGVKAAFWATICSVLQKGIGFLTVPIFTRLLSPYDFGTYNIYLSWRSIISVFATLNLSAGVFTVGLTKFEDDRGRFTSSVLGLGSCVCAGVFIILCVFSSVFSKLTGVSLLFFILMFDDIFFTIALNLWSQGERYEYRYKKLFLVTILLSIFNPVIGILGVNLLSNKVFARVLSICIVQTVVVLPLFIVQYKKGKSFFVKKYWKYALSFSLPLVPHYLSMIILNSSDKIMINQICGSEKTAFYSVAWTISMALTIVVTAVNGSYSPFVFQNLKKKNYTVLSKISNFLIAVFGIICILFVFIVPELLQLAAPKNYYDARWVTAPLVSSVFFIFLYSVFGNIEFYFEKKIYIMIASVIGAVMNVILNRIFIAKFGYYAAGYTTLFCYVCFSIAHFVMMRFICKKEIKHLVFNGKFILLLSVLFALAELSITLLYDYPVIRFGAFLTVLILLFLFRKKILYPIKQMRGLK